MELGGCWDDVRVLNRVWGVKGGRTRLMAASHRMILIHGLVEVRTLAAGVSVQCMCKYTN